MSKIPTLAGFAPVEDELAVLPGDQPGTAVRVRLVSGQDECVRLEQLAYSQTVGWYVQKSFCVPRELLQDLSLQLRRADCLMPCDQTHSAHAAPLRLFPAATQSQPLRLRRA